LLGGLAILALGLGVITYLEYRTRRIFAAQDVPDCLGLRLLGTVPWMPHLPNRGTGPITGRTAVWQTVLTEYVDAASTMLIPSSPTPTQGRTLLVTSAIPGEGKTMLACHLAFSLARTGARTLLIDGDLRR